MLRCSSRRTGSTATWSRRSPSSWSSTACATLPWLPSRAPTTRCTCIWVQPVWRWAPRWRTTASSWGPSSATLTWSPRSVPTRSFLHTHWHEAILTFSPFYMVFHIIIFFILWRRLHIFTCKRFMSYYRKSKARRHLFARSNKFKHDLQNQPPSVPSLPIQKWNMHHFYFKRWPPKKEEWTSCLRTTSKNNTDCFRRSKLLNMFAVQCFSLSTLTLETRPANAVQALMKKEKRWNRRSCCSSNRGVATGGTGLWSLKFWTDSGLQPGLCRKLWPLLCQRGGSISSTLMYVVTPMET